MLGPLASHEALWAHKGSGSISACLLLFMIISEVGRNTLPFFLLVGKSVERPCLAQITLRLYAALLILLLAGAPLPQSKPSLCLFTL